MADVEITETRTVTLDAEEREQFRQELKAAFAARDGGSNDDEIMALWECVGSACGVFDVYEEDTREPKEGD